MEINYSNLYLAKPSMDYMKSYIVGIKEYAEKNVADFTYPKVRTKRQQLAHIRHLDEYGRGIGLPMGYVPCSTFWLVDGFNYLGTGSIRHYLTDKLQNFGGNVGYSIRPAAWARGLGTVQLKLLLEECRLLGINQPLITCFEKNIASIRIIEKNGGHLIKKVNNKFNGEEKLTRIYNINLL